MQSAQPPSISPLTIDPRPLPPHRSTSIPTPPPTAHPSSFSHSNVLVPTNLHARVSPRVGELLQQHQLGTRMLNTQHVFPISPGHHHHHQQQKQQQVSHAPNVITHAQPAPPPPPPQIIQTQVPILPPSTLHQDQQQQQKMTHPPATILASSQEHQYRLATAQLAGAARLTGLQQVQARPQGQQAQRADSSGTQSRGPLRAMQPPSQMPERPHPAAATPTPPPSSSHAHSHTQQSQQQQQQQQDHLTAPPAVAAFRVLQPAKALLEQTWATAIAAVQHELSVIQAEHIRGAREQKRLAELLQRAQAERAQALQALQDTQGQLRDCMRFPLCLFFHDDG
jgi:hypothetical protein